MVYILSQRPSRVSSETLRMISLVIASVYWTVIGNDRVVQTVLLHPTSYKYCQPLRTSFTLLSSLLSQKHVQENCFVSLCPFPQSPLGHGWLCLSGHAAGQACLHLGVSPEGWAGKPLLSTFYTPRPSRVLPGIWLTVFLDSWDTESGHSVVEGAFYTQAL